MPKRRETTEESLDDLRRHIQDLENRRRYCLSSGQGMNEACSCFPEHLVLLHEITLELSDIDLFDAFCLRVVELGRDKLGYGRMGLWFLTETAYDAQGTFGIDECGQIRDERSFRVKVSPENVTGQILQKKMRFAIERDTDLLSHELQVVGQGDRCTSAIWDGRSVIGFLSVDNLLTGKALAELDGELLAQYAALIGHMTSRIRIQEALRKSEATLQSILRAAPVGIGLVTNRVLGWANDEVLRMLGYTREELMGQSARLLYESDDEFARVGREKHGDVQYRGVGFIRTRWVRKDGSVFEVQLQSAAIDPHRFSSGLVYTAVDLTHEIEEERKRKSMEARLQESHRLESLGVLAGGIAHDFNNLLMGILGNADLALNELPGDSPLRHYLGAIGSATRQAADLCTQMLAYAGKGRLLVGDLDVNEQLRGMVRMLNVSTSGRTPVRLNLCKAVPPIRGDATQLRQMLMNLVANASESMSKRQGTILITTSVAQLDAPALRGLILGDAAEPGCHVAIEVQDAGHGMSEEVLKRVFEPFYSTRFTGRGLGLPAVMGIMRSHRGALLIQSQPDHGSVVRLYLPASSQVPLPAQANDACVADEDWKGSGRILLADDEASVRRIVSKMIQRMGFEVTEAEDGQAALEIFRRAGPFDCILLDLLMPRMDGVETRSAIHTIDPGIPVILSSGFTEHEISERLSGVPIAGFIQKPYRLDALRNLLRNVLG